MVSEYYKEKTFETRLKFDLADYLLWACLAFLGLTLGWIALLAAAIVGVIIALAIYRSFDAENRKRFRQEFLWGSCIFLFWGWLYCLGRVLEI